MTTGISNEWDPGDPLEIHAEHKQAPATAPPQVGDIAILRGPVLTYVGMVQDVSGNHVIGTATVYETDSGKFYGVSSYHYWEVEQADGTSATLFIRSKTVQDMTRPQLTEDSQ